MVKLLCRNGIQEIEGCVGDLIKYTVHIYLHLDAYVPIFCKLGMVIDLTNLYSFIPV